MSFSHSKIVISSTAKTPNENAVVSPRKFVTRRMPVRSASGSGLISSGVRAVEPPGTWKV